MFLLVNSVGIFSAHHASGVARYSRARPSNAHARVRARQVSHTAPSSRVNPRSSARSCVDTRPPDESVDPPGAFFYRERNDRTDGSGDRRGSRDASAPRARPRVRRYRAIATLPPERFAAAARARARRGDVDVPSTCIFVVEHTAWRVSRTRTRERRGWMFSRRRRRRRALVR